MATTKTLFDAVEGELKNVRVAISNADRYLDTVKEAVEIMAAKVKIIEEVGIAPLVKAPAKEEEEERKGSRPDFGVDIKRVVETINGVEIITLVNGVKIATGNENKAVGEFLKPYV